MPKFAPVNAIVTSVDLGGGKAVVEITAAKSTMTLDLPSDSAWVKYLTEGAVLSYTIDVTQLGAPAPDVVTTTALQSATSGEGIVDPSTGQFIQGQTYKTPASDVPAPTITNDHPAANTSNALANTSIDKVKAALFG